MRHDWRFCAGAGNYLNACQDNEMREPGVEPGILSEPDPKAHSAPDSTAAAQPNLAPAATEIPPDATPGTTGIATRESHDIDGSYYCDECGALVTGGLDYCPFCGEPQS